MEIPDSDEEEEKRLPDIIQDEHPKHQNRPASSPIQFIERVFLQLDNITTSTPPQRHQQQQQQQPQPQQNPFSTLSPTQLSQVKPLMLTLHCLFPNELLLALDILDRGLVRRFAREDQRELQRNCDLEENMAFSSSFPPEISSSLNPVVDESVDERVEDLFFVVSASTSAPRFTSTRQEEVKGYEVRLRAWNCTCQAFVLSAFRGDLGSELDLESHYHDQRGDEVDDVHGNPTDAARGYCFGGTLSRGPTRLFPPICKHLLACFLLVRCPTLFGTGAGTELYRISAKELAGWCAGWGGWSMHLAACIDWSTDKAIPGRDHIPVARSSVKNQPLDLNRFIIYIPMAVIELFWMVRYQCRLVARSSHRQKEYGIMEKTSYYPHYIT